MPPTPRFKNVGGNLVLRNDADNANANLELALIKITAGSPGAGKILTSDLDGDATWETNAAIDLANNAQTAANNAQTSANAAQLTADGAASAAAAAATAASAAAAAATAAGIAAGIANGLAVAAGIDAANAQSTANDAFALADLAYDKVLVAYQLAFRVFGDELFPTVGTPTYNLSALYPYNNAIIMGANNDSAYTLLSLRAGTWTIKFLTQNATSLGRVTIALNGSPIVDPQDLYSTTADQKKVYTYAGYTVPADGYYTLSFTNSGKNGASSGFGTIIQKCWGIRTGV